MVGCLCGDQHYRIMHGAWCYKHKILGYYTDFRQTPKGFGLLPVCTICMPIDPAK